MEALCCHKETDTSNVAKYYILLKLLKLMFMTAGA